MTCADEILGSAFLGSLGCVNPGSPCGSQIRSIKCPRVATTRRSSGVICLIVTAMPNLPCRIFRLLFLVAAMMRGKFRSLFAGENVLG